MTVIALAEEITKINQKLTVVQGMVNYLNDNLNQVSVHYLLGSWYSQPCAEALGITRGALEYEIKLAFKDIIDTRLKVLTAQLNDALTQLEGEIG